MDSRKSNFDGKTEGLKCSKYNSDILESIQSRQHVKLPLEEPDKTPLSQIKASKMEV